MIQKHEMKRDINKQFSIKQHEGNFSVLKLNAVLVIFSFSLRYIQTKLTEIRTNANEMQMIHN